MMNSNDPATNTTHNDMGNGAMQQPLTPSGNGNGALKDSAEANKMKSMPQQNTNQ